MTFRFLAAVGMLTALTACGPDAPPGAPADPANAVNSNAQSTSAAPSASPAALAAVIPPKDARFTIFCLSINGPNHTERATQAKLLWQQATGRRDWYVIHQDDQSSLYFGYYSYVSDSQHAKESARAVSDRQMIQNLKDSVGDYPFAHAILMPLSAPDPTAPPEWNLVNSKGYWSVEIASFRGTPLPGSPDRKTAAVETVRDMRAHGIEAYYYQGEAVSSVCIGAWPKEAIQQPEENFHNNDPEKSLMIVPEQLAHVLPDSATDKAGNETQIVHDEAKIVDPTMLDVLRKYPVHSLNGNEDIVVTSGQSRERPSFPVEIPHTTAAAGESAPAGPRIDLLGGDNSPPDSSTKLRSVGQ
jgi:hypothetical protein